MALPIGIDLGTTYSCVAVYQEGKVHIISDKGDRTIPSWVAFTGSERLIGAGAKEAAALYPKDTVYDVKRIIGRKMDDPIIMDILQNKKYPFGIEPSAKETPLIKAEYRGKLASFTPEQISAIILGHIKKLAGEYLKEDIKKAVITVPAYFNDSQRQATIDAGKIAGLEVMAIISEPTAAAIAYGLEKKQCDKNVLVFDFGGGTCDVSILNLRGGQIKVKAVAGNSSLGGRDIDERLVENCLEFFQRNYQLDAKSSPSSMHRLQEACERTKRTLSSSLEARISLENFYSGKPLEKSFTRTRFNDLCKDLFQETIELIKRAMKDAKCVQCDIDDVVMVGGSSYIPEVKRLVKEYFDWKDLTISINPDESVAYGAAVHAAVLGGDKSEDIKDILLMDVTPLSLGSQIMGGLMSVVVERNTPIPCRKERVYFTIYDNQTSMDIIVLQGERKLSKDNTRLGNFLLTGIPAAPRGVSKIDEIFELDTNGILTVTAVDKTTGNSNKIEIVQDKGRLSDQEINDMIEEAKRFEEDDRKREDEINARLELEYFLSDVKSAANRSSVEVLPEMEKEIIMKFCEDEFIWLEDNATADVNQYDHRLVDVNRGLAQYMARLKLK